MYTKTPKRQQFAWRITSVLRFQNYWCADTKVSNRLFRSIHTLCAPSPSIYSTQACFKVSYKEGKCVLTRDRLQSFHFNSFGMAQLSQPGFVSGQYKDNYFCTWNLPDPKPQHRYELYLLEKDFHPASGGVDQCHCHDHMTVQSHGEAPKHLCGGATHPQNDKWCKLGASECLHPSGIKYESELWVNLVE